MSNSLTMDTKTIIDLVGYVCNESKGVSTKAYILKDPFSYTDANIITSARSDRHTSGIANRIISECEKLGIEIQGIEGLEQSHWIIIDLSSVVIHVFYEPKREYYGIEELWEDSTVIDLESNIKAA